MKTYTKTIEETKPRLVIRYDNDSDSPREWDNLGYFVTRERDYQSPDGKLNDAYTAMVETADEARSTDHHMQLIKERLGNVVFIAPITRYEHGEIIYRRGTGQGFDDSNCGFYIVTKESAEKLGTPEDIETYKRIIDDELKTYTQWANGEIYGFTLYDEKGEFEDSCWGFYDLEAIKQNLPEEWQGEDLSEYIIN